MTDLADAFDRAGANLGITPPDADPALSQGSIEWGDGDTGTATFLVEADADTPVDLDTAEQALNRFAAVMLGPERAMLRILDIVEVTLWGWCPATSAPYRRFKAKVRRPRDAAAQAAVDRLLDRAATLRARRPPAVRKTGTPTEVFELWADCQAGKGDGAGEMFGSTPDMIDRADWYIDHGFAARHRALVGQGLRPDVVHMALMGDLTEGVDGSYPGQTHSVELDTSEQLEVAIALAHRGMDRLAQLYPAVRITGVASNHDQASRGSGKDNITTDWDDRTFTVLRALGRLVATNPDRYANVQVALPKDPVVAVLSDVQGLGVALTHGHKLKWAVSAIETVQRWHDGQRSGRTEAGRCDVVLAAHWHHEYHRFDSGRFIGGARSMDGGSKFLTDRSGTWSIPGLTGLAVADGAVVDFRSMMYPPDLHTARERFGPVAG